MGSQEEDKIQGGLMERTLCIVKPDGVRRKLVGEVLRRIEGAGFGILDLKMLRLQREEAELLYDVHQGKPFFADLVEFMTSGPLVALLLEKENGISDLRSLLGKTDPSLAKRGTIRGDLGGTKQKNLVHASDSPLRAEKEIAVFFSEFGR